MKRFGNQKPVRFDEKELKTDLGQDNFIFVGSSCDIFAEKIPYDWIYKTLKYCRGFNNKYLFQSKNPKNFLIWWKYLKGSILGTTIESDIWHHEMGDAPLPEDRAVGLRHMRLIGYKTMITIEPIMDFTNELVSLVKFARPSWVNIGANTNSKVKLPEPEPEKIQELIERLREITEVKIKSNLKRLWKQK
jgi:hypothetical protein